nr:MAG TPA: hypothetical protein [Caudoviricetes sp.]
MFVLSRAYKPDLLSKFRYVYFSYIQLIFYILITISIYRVSGFNRCVNIESS